MYSHLLNDMDGHIPRSQPQCPSFTRDMCREEKRHRCSNAYQVAIPTHPVELKWMCSLSQRTMSQNDYIIGLLPCKFCHEKCTWGVISSPKVWVSVNPKVKYCFKTLLYLYLAEVFLIHTHTHIQPSISFMKVPYLFLNVCFLESNEIDSSHLVLSNTFK